MKSKVISLLVILMILIAIPACLSAKPLVVPQNQKAKQAKSFYLLWQQADSLTNLGQPQSALEIVNKIYLRAKAEKNDPQSVRAVIYRIRLNSEFQENFLVSTIFSLQKEISISGYPARQILKSILAEIYWKYYQNNQYRFNNRTQAKTIVPDSIETWDLKTISSSVFANYLASLENPDTLKRTPVGGFDVILEPEGADGKNPAIQLAVAAKFYPTIYDFLAGRALDFFTTNNGTAIFPAGHFEIDQPLYFSQTAAFSAGKGILPKDSSSAKNLALLIFRDLAAFHLADKDPRALIETELRRFRFVHDEYVLPGKDSLYLDALLRFEKTHIASPWATAVSYTIARHLNDQGQLYNPLAGDSHKWDLRSAVAVCEKACKLFPVSEGANNCSILAKSIKNPLLLITAETAVPAGKSSLALVQFSNLNTLFFRVVKTDPERFAEATANEPKLLFRNLAGLPAAKSWSQVLPTDGDFQKHAVEITIPGVPAGFYAIICSSTEDFSDARQVFAYTPFWSTQISYISRRTPEGGLGYFLLDRESGLPLKNARVEAWVRNWDYGSRKNVSVKQQDLSSDEDGYFSIPAAEAKGPNPNIFLKIFFREDFLTTDNFYRYPVYSYPERTILQTMFYADRAIYRPGQTISFKGIIVERTGNSTAIKPNYFTKVLFTDVNGQKIAEQQLTSNAFGSFSGSFSAPLGVLPGQMTISNESGSLSVSVEEYKRPTFEVTYEPLEGNYRLGEMITVSGKASSFAGNAVDGARVKYRIARNARFPYPEWGWYRPLPISAQAEITSGTAVTDPSGKFSFSFTAIPDRSVDAKSGPVFDFTIYTDVTDLNGETQSVSQNVSVGYNSLIIGINLTGMVNLASDSLLKISATNLNGRSTPAKVSVALFRLRQPARAFKPRQWSRPDLNLLSSEDFHAQFPCDIYGDENNPETWPVEGTLFEKTINTLTDSIIKMPGQSANPVPSAYGPGSWLLVLRSTDPFGGIVEKRQVFTAFSPSSKEVPVNTLNWFVPLKTSGEPGESARFLIGTREDHVSMIYEISHNDTLVSREWINLGDRARLLEIPILEKYRGNFAVNFIFVKHNRVFQNSELVNVPYTSKKLGVVFETFRSKLDPGAKETWKIRITRANGKAAEAELMAAMYDASLDMFRSNNWQFNIYQRYSGLNPWTADNAFRKITGTWGAPAQVTDKYSGHSILRLNWFGLNYFGGSARNILYSRVMGDKRMGLTPASLDGEASTMTVATNVSEAPQPAKSTDETVAPQTRPAVSQGIQVRRDFRETAFFYPSVLTDSTGSLTLGFTTPESLTRWKLLGLAHTKSLEYGLVEKELVTRKDLMVFPNAPRFVRQGDTVIFSAKIGNLADRALTGQVSIELSDGLTLQSCNDLLDTPGMPGSAPRTRDFDAKKGQSVMVSWKLVIPVNYGLSLLQYRVTAVSGNFSDGEEKAIPVLTNRMMVTESLPLPVRGKGTTEFTFDKLLSTGQPTDREPTLKNYRLTLEFASNPAWYAIQALPSLDEKLYDNADAVFAAYWSNSVASFIANSNPKIKAVFESWKNLTPDALQSNLAKNQQLKTALLQETPWVADATSETGRKQKLGTYFDLNTINAKLQENLKLLQKLQTPNGGWSWFAGMPESRYTTQNIVTGLGRLQHLGITNIMKDESTRQMVIKAIGYLDEEFRKDYESIKKSNAAHLDDNHLGSTQVQYLYARSYFLKEQGAGLGEPGSKLREAFGYYQKQAERYWLQNDRYLQGMIALALNRLGRGEVSQLIMKSLGEKALHSPELGMYWAGEAGYYWYQAPIETQALMVEAFDEAARNPSLVEELKIWLLKQKQTQDWRSSRATLEACYALLLRGTDLLAEDPGVKITLGREKINSDKPSDITKEAGTGYFQTSWSGKEITPDMGKITVTKSSQGIAWGAVYWQYFDNLDKITPAATPMKLEKKLFLEKNTNSGPVLEPFENTGHNSNGIAGPGLLVTGDKVVVRIILKVDRDLEFVHMKDMRASAFEPVSSAGREGEPAEGLSGYRYQDGLGYYQSTTDLATNFFFDYLPRGTYVFEYPLRANAAGEYSNGITTIQCMYAPEFTAHSEGIRISVK